MQVLVGDNARFRKFGDNATRISDASPIQYEDLQVGDKVYVRGSLPGRRSGLARHAGGEGRSARHPGTILSVDTVQSSLKLREFGSGRKFNVSLPAGEVYKASDSRRPTRCPSTRCRACRWFRSPSAT